MKNPKTTGLGISALLIILGTVGQQYFGTGELPSGPEIGGLLSGVVSALGLIFARDAQTPETVVERKETIEAR